MAPPRNRRPGFSRRIQLGLFLSYVVAVVGVVCGLGLLLLSRLDPTAFSTLRGTAIDVSAPLTNAGRAIIRTAQGAEESVNAYFFAASQNKALHEEMAIARRKLIQAQTIALENQRLRTLLKLSDHPYQPVASARLIGSGLASPRRFATLSAGSDQGVARGQPVIAAEGLVGRVLETGRHAARILLLTDGESAVPGRLLRDGTPALIRGHGDGLLAVHALLPGARPFRRHDLIVTSATGGLYPPDIPVAIITHVDGDSAIAWPLANPDRLDFAIVVQPYLPQLPAPTETGADGR